MKIKEEMYTNKRVFFTEENSSQSIKPTDYNNGVIMKGSNWCGAAATYQIQPKDKNYYNEFKPKKLSYMMLGISKLNTKDSMDSYPKKSSPLSYAIYSHNGGIYSHNGENQDPTTGSKTTFKANDIIGIEVDYGETTTLSFYKNKTKVCSIDIECESYYPTVWLCTSGDEVEAGMFQY
jgi:hypothetical protein